MKSGRGSVLLLVLGVLLVLSILVTAMLRLPGSLRYTVSLVARETQKMYLAESAVLSKLNGFPEGYFAEVPSVETGVLGPWTLWRTVLRTDGQNRFQFLLGGEFGRFSTSEWMRCAVALEQNLRERILQSDFLKLYSGNRRFFSLDSSMMGQGVPTVLNVSAGDLTLDLGGNNVSGSSLKRPLVRSFMANVEGDVKIRGRVHFDTLRIYATGTVTIQGDVTANFVEIFGLVGVFVSGEVSLAGVLLSKQNIEISNRAKLNFPSTKNDHFAAFGIDAVRNIVVDVAYDLHFCIPALKKTLCVFLSQQMEHYVFEETAKSAEADPGIYDFRIEQVHSKIKQVPLKIPRS